MQLRLIYYVPHGYRDSDERPTAIARTMPNSRKAPATARMDRLCCKRTIRRHARDVRDTAAAFR